MENKHSLIEMSLTLSEFLAKNLGVVMFLACLLGHFYYDSYYDFYGINIFAYSTFSDLVYNLPKILIFASIFILGWFAYNEFIKQVIYLLINRTRLKVFYLNYSKVVQNVLMGILASLIHILITILILLILVFFDIQPMHIVVTFLLYGGIFFIINYLSEEYKYVERIAFLVFSYFIIGQFGLNDAVENRSQTNDISMRFSHSGKYYDTKKMSLLLVGENQGYMFLYDQTDGKTLVFNKQGIVNYEIDSERTLRLKARELNYYLNNNLDTTELGTGTVIPNGTTPYRNY